ncbi:hypothetical protein WJ968_13390 [Achromobacter xylosoxidans]
MSDSTATPRIEPPASKPGMGWPARITLALLLIGAIFAVLHLATGWAREGALREAAQLARNASQINAALLRNNGQIPRAALRADARCGPARGAAGSRAGPDRAAR